MSLSGEKVPSRNSELGNTSAPVEVTIAPDGNVDLLYSLPCQRWTPGEARPHPGGTREHLNPFPQPGEHMERKREMCEKAIALVGFFALILMGLTEMKALGGVGELKVYQDLEEVTLRIRNLRNKPYLELIEANDGFFQSEVMIFKDLETGNEIWSLTREECTDLANIERRTAWSCNGQYISFIGNMAFLDYATGKIRRGRWAGHSYIANSDGSKRRKLWGMTDGNLRTFEDKFNNWDAARPNVLYYPGGDKLWRITLGGGVKDNKAEPVHTFRDERGRIVQEVSDENFMLIEESGEKPNCYVVNLNVDPSDPHFVLSYPLKGEVHPGSFRFMRSKRAIRGHYERGGQAAGISLVFDEQKIEPAEYVEVHITEGRRMHHLWYGSPDDRVGFFGTYKGRSGLFLQMPGQRPVMMGDTPDGHVSWCSHDPEWFFAAVGPGGRREYGDPQYVRRIVACNADGKTVKILCTPFDRRRGGRRGYDAIPRPNQSPDATKCWFHSSMLQASDRFTGSYIAVFRRPYPPTELKLSDSANGVELQWTLHELSYEVKGSHVYRSDDGGKTFSELTDEAISETAYADTSVEPGRTYTYAVTCEEYSRLESDVTSPTIAIAVDEKGEAKLVATGEPVRDWDKTVPAKLAGFSAERMKNGLIALEWERSRDKDFRYYNIYASSKGRPDVSQKRLLVSPPYDETRYVDWSAPRKTAMHYAMTVIDRQGNESEPVYVEID